MGGRAERNGLFRDGFGEVELGTLDSDQRQYEIGGSGILEDKEGNHSRQGFRPAFQTLKCPVIDCSAYSCRKVQPQMILGAAVAAAGHLRRRCCCRGSHCSAICCHVQVAADMATAWRWRTCAPERGW